MCFLYLLPRSISLNYISSLILFSYEHEKLWALSLPFLRIIIMIFPISKEIKEVIFHKDKKRRCAFPLLIKSTWLHKQLKHFIFKYSILLLQYMLDKRSNHYIGILCIDISITILIILTILFLKLFIILVQYSHRTYSLF